LPAGVAGKKLIGFTAVAVSSADTVVVPKGYRVQTLVPWGTPITGNMPAFDPLKNTGADQASQVGSHHDGMHFFPIEGKDPYNGSSSEGLLVMNHEYVEPRYMHASAVGQKLSSGAVPALVNGKRPADECRKEFNGHGVSVVHIRRGENGRWDVVPELATAASPGHADGHQRPGARHRDRQTRYSPDGTRTRGTLNNCAHGVTPWNTYMMAEENWAGYFINRVAANGRTREQSRYGVRHNDSKPATSRYGWELADSGADEFARFDVSAKGANATQDLPQRGQRFWLDGGGRSLQPRQHAGQAHGAGPLCPRGRGVPARAARAGRWCVTRVTMPPTNTSTSSFPKACSARPAGVANGALLDEGTLYVARFNDDGTGEWLPLVFGQGPLTPGRFSAARPMCWSTPGWRPTAWGQPRWTARSGAPSTRTAGRCISRSPTTAAAPPPTRPTRAKRAAGATSSAGRKPATTRGHAFNWDIFLLAGPENDSSSPASRSTSRADSQQPGRPVVRPGWPPVDPDRHQRKRNEQGRLRAVRQQPDAVCRPAHQ
jgi:uncharacterized protein